MLCSVHVEQLTIDRVYVYTFCTPNGIRTRAATLKGWCPRPLDDGGMDENSVGRASEIYQWQTGFPPSIHIPWLINSGLCGHHPV